MAEFTAKDVMSLRERTGAGMMDCKKALTAAEGDVDKAIDILREKGLAAAAKKAGRIAAEGLVAIAFNADSTAAAMVEVNAETDFVAKNPEFIELVQNIADAALNNAPADLEALLAAAYPGGGSVQDAVTAKIAKIGENMSVRRFARMSGAGKVYGSYLHGNGKVGVLVEMATTATGEQVSTLGRNVSMQVASMNPQFVDETSVDQEWLEKEQHILLQQALNENAELEKPKPEAIVEKMVQGRMKKELKETCLVDQAYVKNSEQSVAQYVAAVGKEIGAEVKLTAFVRYQVGEGIEKRQDDLAAEVAKMTQK